MHNKFVLDAVLTSARCCLSLAKPALPVSADFDVSAYGFHVTIGASRVQSTEIILRSAPDGGYYEFVAWNSGRIFTPPEYARIPGQPAKEWDVCLIKITRVHDLPKGAEPDIGNTSNTHCSQLISKMIHRL